MADYDFLNEYVNRITGVQASDKPLVDKNAFYDNDEEEQDPEVAQIDQQFQSAADAFANDWNAEESTDENLDDSTNGNEDSPLQDDNEEDESTSDDESSEAATSDEVDLHGLGNPAPYHSMGDYQPAGGYKPGGPYVNSTSDTLSSQIADKESQGKYTAFNSAGGGSGAVGKYQFRWNIWKDSIQQVTGVKTQQQFLKSPAAQEKYFQFYNKTVLQPEVKNLQPYNHQHLSNDQLAKLVHFRGAEGARKYLLGQVKDKPETYNSSISSYIGTKQTGGTVLNPMDTLAFNAWKAKLPKNLQYEGDYDLRGLWQSNPTAQPSANMHFPDTYKLPNHPTFSDESRYYNDSTRDQAGHWQETDSSYNYVPFNPKVKKGLVERKQIGGVAVSRQEQYTGLNNPNYDHMMFPMEGDNEFRGLDDGSPVFLQDEQGKTAILRGKHDKTKMKGRVFEKRI